MVTQKTLRKIRKDLRSTFSIFGSHVEVSYFVGNEMRKNYITANFYTDERCSVVYKSAIEYLEKTVNEKYNQIAKQINEYINGLNEDLKINQIYGSSNADTLKHLVIGAGAGLGAAIILGGPVGWMIGIGAGIAALYNSSEKKRELISRILSVANKINQEAINKLTDILDLYIVDEEILLLPPVSNVASKEDVVVENLTKAQIEIKKFLEKRDIRYLVHFTDESNIKSILKHGLCSPKEGKKRGIEIRVNDNGISAHRADRYMKSTNDDYISLTVTTTNEKVLSAFKGRKSIKNVKRILIDASVLWKEINNDRLYCNMNAAATSLKCGSGINAFEGMFAPFVEQFDPLTGETESTPRKVKSQNIATHEQAEILFQSHIDPKYFVNYNELKKSSNDNDFVFSDDLGFDDLPF